MILSDKFCGSFPLERSEKVSGFGEHSEVGFHGSHCGHADLDVILAPVSFLSNLEKLLNLPES